MIGGSGTAVPDALSNRKSEISLFALSDIETRQYRAVIALDAVNTC
jgi:hypothetical protein